MFNADQMNQVVSAAVVAALETQAQPILAEIVKSIIGKTVNRNGNEPTYQDKEKTTFLEYLVRRHLEASVEATVREWVKTQDTAIEATVRAAIDSDSLTQSLKQMFVEQIEKGYVRVNLAIEPPQKRDDY